MRVFDSNTEGVMALFLNTTITKDTFKLNKKALHSALAIKLLDLIALFH